MLCDGSNRLKADARSEQAAAVAARPDVRRLRAASARSTSANPLQRERLEGLFAAAFCLRRALQRDARSRLDAYWAAHHERAAKGSAAVRKRLGLSREALERAAYRHLSRAPHLRLHATKAMAMHLADSVWVDVKRHLFADSRGRRSGKPKVGRWHRFHRIPGRARSHTRPRKWETFQLHGTLSGHQKAYTGTDGRFFQPHSMRPVLAPGSSWFRHQGALVVVFTGLGSGELVLPVRLPISPCNQRILEHYLSDPDRWHKIDLVRRQDPTGRWRYEAHLMVLTAPYASPKTVEWRAIATRLSAGRQAGIDVNVSNISVASHQNGQDLRISRFERDAGDRESVGRLAARKRRRERALERSRRAANPEQYHLSKRQEERARRRVEAGLPTPPVIPKGPRRHAPMAGRSGPSGKIASPAATGEHVRPWRRMRLPPRRRNGTERAGSPNWSSCGTACGSPSRPATSRPGHGCGAVPCTPSRRARSSPPSSGRRPRLPPRPVSQLGSRKHPPARLLSRNIACAANVSRRHFPTGPTTGRAVAWPVIATRSRPRWRLSSSSRIPPIPPLPPWTLPRRRNHCGAQPREHSSAVPSTS